MKQTLTDIVARAEKSLQAAGHAACAEATARNCAWLEACGYPGLKILAEALADEVTSGQLEPDALGLDLKNISCVFIGGDVERLRTAHDRLFLRNVRHGLYLLPGSVRDNYGIGCPVDPGFALGGERHKNPYGEKYALAARDGVMVDAALWQHLGA